MGYDDQVNSRSHSVVIVHDFLTQRGGAERVVLAMARTFPEAPIYTSLFEPDATFPEFSDLDVRPLVTNRVATLRHDHRKGLLIYPFVFSALHLDAEVAICSSTGFAHGVRTSGRKIFYCHSPARWLYGEAAPYLAGHSVAARGAAAIFRKPLQVWDRAAARSADTVVTNSNAVRLRIAAEYAITASLLPPPAPRPHPPMALSGAGLEPGFILCVSRLLSYKNVDAVIRSFGELPDARLIVVGDGPERRALDAIAGPNVSLLGRIEDGELAWLYSNCAALVSASYEDFGLTPLEAGSYGKPSAVLRAGGFLDTVIEGSNGVFFDVPEPTAIAASLRLLLQMSWQPDRIRSMNARFSEEAFSATLGLLVAGHATK